MYLKVMGDDKLLDSDPSKFCTMFSDVRSVKYEYDVFNDAYCLNIKFKDGSTDEVAMYYEDYDGQVIFRPRAYLMNDEGKTVQTFALPQKLLNLMATASLT